MILGVKLDDYAQQLQPDTLGAYAEMGVRHLELLIADCDAAGPFLSADFARRMRALTARYGFTLSYHATPGIVFLFIPIAKVWFGQKENRQFGLFFSYGLKQAFMCGFQISYIRRIVVVIANERPHGQRRKITRHCLFAAAASGKTQIDMVATEHPRYNRRIGVSRNTGTSALGD